MKMKKELAIWLAVAMIVTAIIPAYAAELPEENIISGGVENQAVELVEIIAEDNDEIEATEEIQKGVVETEEGIEGVDEFIENENVAVDILEAPDPKTISVSTAEELKHVLLNAWKGSHIIIDADITYDDTITLDNMTLTVNEGYTLKVSKQIELIGSCAFNGGGTIKRNADILLFNSSESITIDNITLDGGAVWCEDESCVEPGHNVEDDILRSNHNIGINATTFALFGAAGTFIMNDCVVQNVNSTRCIGSFDALDEISINRTVFRNNTKNASNGYCDALFSFWGAVEDGTFNSSEFYGNLIEGGAGNVIQAVIACTYAGPGTISFNECEFHHNSDTTKAVGLFLPAKNCMNFELNDCIIRNHSVPVVVEIHNWSPAGTTILNNCTVSDHKACIARDNTGALYTTLVSIDGGSYVLDDSVSYYFDVNAYQYCVIKNVDLSAKPLCAASKTYYPYIEGNVKLLIPQGITPVLLGPLTDEADLTFVKATTTTHVGAEYTMEDDIIQHIHDGENTYTPYLNLAENRVDFATSPIYPSGSDVPIKLESSIWNDGKKQHSVSVVKLAGTKMNWYTDPSLEEQYKIPDAQLDPKTSSPVFENVGTATFYYKAELEGYNTVSGSVTYTVTAKEITVPTGKTLTYTGSLQKGVDDSDWYTVTDGSATGDPNEIKVYTARVNLKDKINTVWKTIGTTDEQPVEFTINPDKKEPNFRFSEEEKNVKITDPAFTVSILDLPEGITVDNLAFTSSNANIAVVSATPSITITPVSNGCCEIKAAFAGNTEYKSFTASLWVAVSSDDLTKHIFGEPFYTWSKDCTKCTATVICMAQDHEVNQVVAATLIDKEGQQYYRAEFDNSGYGGRIEFKTQETKKPVDPINNSNSRSTTLFTGTVGNPVSNGTWTYDKINKTWSYATTRNFSNTWGYICNPWNGNNPSWFYFDRNGKMLIGWQWIMGKDGKLRCYYLNPTSNGTLGACLIGPAITPDGWVVDATGALTVNGIVITK